MDRPCTNTVWRVRPGSDAGFLETAHELAGVLFGLPNPPGGLTLVQSIEGQAVFATIGWFHRQEDLDAMRENDEARWLLERLVSLCSEFRPTAHRVLYSQSGTSGVR